MSSLTVPMGGMTMTNRNVLDTSQEHADQLLNTQDETFTACSPDPLSGDQRPALRRGQFLPNPTRTVPETIAKQLRELAESMPDQLTIDTELHRLWKTYESQGAKKGTLKETYKSIEATYLQEHERAKAAEIASLPPLAPTGDELKAMRIASVLKRQPNLFPLFRKCLRQNGYIATENFSDTLLITQGQRLLPNSNALGVYGSYAAGKSDGVLKANEFLPPERVLSITTISAKGIFYIGSIKNNCLIFGEMNPTKDELDDQRQCALRQLISENQITNFTVEKADGYTNQGVKKTTEGPAVIVFTTTTEPHRWESQLRSRCAWLRADDSEGTTEQIIDSVASKAAGRGGRGLSKHCLNGWQEFHRSLEQLSVAIPFANEIKPKSRKTAIRRIFKLLLDCVRASALLHQHVRQRNDQGHLIAAWADYQVAHRLIKDNAPRMARVISPESRETFNTKIKPLFLVEDGNGDNDSKAVSGPDIRRALDVGRSQAGRFIDDCEQAGLLIFLESGGRGNAKRYKLGTDDRNEADDLGLADPEYISSEKFPATNQQILQSTPASEILVPSPRGTNREQITNDIIPPFVPEVPEPNQMHIGSIVDHLSICSKGEERLKNDRVINVE